MKTIIERYGREFELPDAHRLAVYEGRETHVALEAPGAGASLFTLRIPIERRPDTLVVHLGEEVGRSGPGTFGDVTPHTTGYPFPA